MTNQRNSNPASRNRTGVRGQPEGHPRPDK
jgi:hypothetical protein